MALLVVNKSWCATACTTTLGREDIKALPRQFAQCSPTEELLGSGSSQGDGIDRDVISTELSSYLGNDATVRPGNGVGEYQGVQGYWIKAFRSLTSAMVEDWKADSQLWRQEQRQPDFGVSYESSRTYNESNAAQIRRRDRDTHSPEIDGYRPSGFRMDAGQADPRRQAEYLMQIDTPPADVSSSQEYQQSQPNYFSPDARGQYTADRGDFARAAPYGRIPAPPRDNLDRGFAQNAYQSNDLLLPGYVRQGDYHVPITTEYPSSAPVATVSHQVASLTPWPVRLGSDGTAEMSADQNQSTMDDLSIDLLDRINDLDRRVTLMSILELLILRPQPDRRTCQILIAQLAHFRAHGSGESSNSHGTAGNSQESSADGRQESLKRSDGREDLNSAGREPYSKRRNTGVRDPDMGDGNTKRLPCIFRVGDPTRFEDHRTRYPFIAKLQNHLRIGHKYFACGECFIKFEDELAASTHEHSRACARKACRRRIPRGRLMWGSCDCLIAAERQWLGLFRLQFPSCDPPDQYASVPGGIPKLYEEIETCSTYDILRGRPQDQNLTSTDRHDLESAFEWPLIVEHSTSDSFSNFGLIGEIQQAFDATRGPQQPPSGLEQENRRLRAEIQRLRQELSKKTELRRSNTELQLSVELLELKVKNAEQCFRSSRDIVDLLFEKLKATGSPDTRVDSALSRIVNGLPQQTSISIARPSSSAVSAAPHTDVEDFGSWLDWLEMEEFDDSDEQ